MSSLFLLFLTVLFYCYQPFSIEAAKPKLLEMPKTIELVENMSYILQCNSLSGDGQQLSFHWLKDNVQIDQFKVDSEKAFSTLSLINLKRNHSGVYTCRAQSTVDGSADSVSSRLIVQGQAPKLYQLPSQVELEERLSFTFTCNLISNSAGVRFSWSKDGTELTDDEALPHKSWRIESSKSFSSLTLTTLQRNDSGVYRCQATDNGGSDSTSTQLVIKGFWLFLFFDTISALWHTCALVWWFARYRLNNH
ncbi:hypothetical protein TYRP_004122 [Tyrophagus putrescentiae]|nr:hypothetical protein TYRP_004122 [Tyrophagus putrescentiae]